MTGAGPIRVTDHAVLRWLERSAGLDVERIREALASNAAEVAVHIGCECIVLPDGCRLRLEGAAIVTCLPKRRRGKTRNRRAAP
jgi:hypothetical protein